MSQVTQNNNQITVLSAKQVLMKGEDVQQVFEGPKPIHYPTLVMGAAIMILFGPFVVWQVFWCTIWEWLDKNTLNIVGQFKKWNEYSQSYLTRFVRHPEDAFIVNISLWLGLVFPLTFVYEFYNTLNYGFSWQRCAIYHLFRIGPMYMNFMYVYALTHKEAHASQTGMFAKPYHHYFQHIYNWYIGLFHGVIPGAFTYSHRLNHHKFDNQRLDQVSSADRPRDEILSVIQYLARWFLYSLNISTIQWFVITEQWVMAVKTVLATLYYLVPVFIIFQYHPLFCIVYLVYPFFEANILLACINMAWHAFIEPSDQKNIFINSTTIIEGLNFTLEEEYHVVHHQAAGIHWTKHRDLYEKHYEDYVKAKGSLFYKCNIFELFVLCTIGDYEKLADYYYQPEGKEKTKKLSKPEVVEMLKRRLRHCTWRDRDWMW